MKVKDLIEILKDLSPDREVIMSSDSEGNTYSPLYQCGQCRYKQEYRYAGEVYREPPREPDADGSYEDEAPKDSIPAVVFYPTH